jgi:hypothetical protein
MFAAILLIAASISIIVAIFILQKRHQFTYKDWGELDIPDTVEDSTKRRLKQLDNGAKLLTGISFFFFMAWIEYTMWPYPYAETFAVIGQWGQLIGTLLVLAFAAYKYILREYILGPEQEPPPGPRPNRASVADGETPAANGEPLAANRQISAAGGETSAANRQISAANGHPPAETAGLLRN